MEEFEIWMPVVGYEGRYEVSHFGNVKSVQGKNKGKLLSNNKSGKRLIVGLRIGRLKKAKMVHQLVLGAFHSTKPNGKVCRHLDGNFRNNYIGNLAWGSYHDNMQDALKHGTRFFNKGERHGISKLKNEDVILIKQLLNTDISKHAIAVKFNISRSIIIGISQGKLWKHI